MCFWFKNNLSLKTENPCKCQKQSTDTPCLCTAQHGTAQGPAPRCNNNEDTLAILYITSVSRCNAGSPSPREKQNSCPLAFLPAYAAARMARVHSLSTAAQRLGQPSLPKPEHPEHHCHADTTSSLMGIQHRAGICKPESYRTRFLCHTQCLFN